MGVHKHGCHWLIQLLCPKILNQIQQLKMPVNDQCWHNDAPWAKQNVHHDSTSPPPKSFGKSTLLLDPEIDQVVTINRLWKNASTQSASQLKSCSIGRLRLQHKSVDSIDFCCAQQTASTHNSWHSYQTTSPVMQVKLVLDVGYFYSYACLDGVCVSVSVLVTYVSPAKTAEPIKISFN